MGLRVRRVLLPSTIMAVLVGVGVGVGIGGHWRVSIHGRVDRGVEMGEGLWL